MSVKSLATLHFTDIIFYYMRNPLSQVYELHIESSNSCNLHCNYCYFMTKKVHRTVFPLERLEELLSIFFTHTERQVNLVFHGGEPLMNSADWLDNACNIAKSIAQKNNNNVSFHIQTNGTLLTDEQLLVLVKHNFSVNVSLDGPEQIHNKARGLYQPTVASLNKLKDAGILMGVISVIGKHNYNKIPEVVDHLIQLGIKRYHFNIGSILSQKSSLILSTEDILQYYKESLKSFLDTYTEACNWVLLGKLRRYISNSIPQFACDSPICSAGVHKIHLLPNGDFYPCGSCVNTEQGLLQNCLGNLFQLPSYEEYQQKMVNFHSEYFACRDKCQLCEAAVICDFKCPAFDSIDIKTFENRCKGSQLFYEHLLTIDKSLIEKLVTFYEDCHE